MAAILKKICLGLFVLLPGICIAGSIYSWIDTQGIKHFSNISPPRKAAVQRLLEENFKGVKGHQFEVVKIFDGDTIQVKGFGLKFTIRLVGIDTPELGRSGQKNQPYGILAKQELTRLLLGKTISLTQYGVGGYNRVLAEIFVGETNLNLEMVRVGLAEVYRGKRPRGLNKDLYIQAEKSAKYALRGMWAQKDRYKSPGLWRKDHPPGK
jgi:micrococcal nuclease